MDRRKFFKNLAAGTAVVTISPAIIKAIEQETSGMVKDCSIDVIKSKKLYESLALPFRAFDLVYFYKDDPRWTAMITAVDEAKIDEKRVSVLDIMAIWTDTSNLLYQRKSPIVSALITMAPLREDQGPEGGIKGAKFTRDLEWLKENTLLFTPSYVSENSEYGHYDKDTINGWE